MTVKDVPSSTVIDPEALFAVLSKEILAYLPSPDLTRIRKAFDFALKEHHGQVRRSGEPYFLHLYEATRIGVRLHLDEDSLIALLLHDTIEDCGVTPEQLSKEFGAAIAEIVDGVTKITRIEFESREEKQAENFRKMLIAMSRDIRVILIKLCDRLHNMQTLGTQRAERQRPIAQETYDIYAPIANRLGIHWLKSDLEDLSLMYLRPEMYKLIDDKLHEISPNNAVFIESACKEITQHLREAGLAASVIGRVKHIASIFKKMEAEGKSFDEVIDILGFRVIVPSRHACYEALGVLHSVYKPVPGRFKDFIAMPKPNMYQSLHTTVIGPGGKRIEVQIRTPEMHRVAEDGIAAHWQYKESEKTPTFDLQWVRELVESQVYLKNSDEFIDSVKGELFPEEVFVFTPRGDLFRLPFGSTPVDFAYAVHTDVGHHITGARVNQSMVPLSYRLTNGDTVEVLTAKTHVPSKDWLKFVKTTKAKQRIRAFIRSQEQAQAITLGIDIVGREAKKLKSSLKRMETSGELRKLVDIFGLKSEGELYAELGYGKIPVPRLQERLTQVLAPVVSPGTTEKSAPAPEQVTPLRRIFNAAALAARAKIGVLIDGADGVMVRYARCCDPLPGDRIVGFITRGRGVAIHHAECPQILGADPTRFVEVKWDGERESESRKVKLLVTSQDQLGLLANLTKSITEAGASIFAAQIKTNESGKAINTFEVIVKDADHLNKVRRALEMVPGVIKVERLMPLKEG